MVSNAGLSEKLSKYVDHDRLAENAAQHETHREGFTATEMEAVVSISALLQRQPLTHTYISFLGKKQAQRALDSYLQAGILPYRDIPNAEVAHTYPLDISLGLDEYAFLHHANTSGVSMYGNATLIVDGAVFDDERTIVSPYDIDNLVASSDTAYAQLTKAEKAKIEDEYFSKLVRGSDWLAIQALKIHRQMYENNYDFMIVGAEGLGGEVKHHGVIDSSKILGSITSDAERTSYWQQQAESGFLQSDIYNLLKPELQDQLYEDAKVFWQQATSAASKENTTL